MSYGLTWTDGTDISEAELKNIIISSEYPSLKFAYSGTGSVTYTHDGGETDILVETHDLDYEPLFYFQIQWFDINSDSKQTDYRRAPLIDTLLDGSVYFDCEPYVNDTQLRLSVVSYTGSGTESITLKYQYFIYYDQDQ
jgi:hypothetical protein